MIGRCVSIFGPIGLSAAALVFGLCPAYVAAQTATWTMSSLNQDVSPLQHTLSGRMPLLTQDLPEMPINDAAVTMRNNGTLRTNVNTLWSKGVVPLVSLALGSSTIDGAIATGATLQDAGVPVHVKGYLLGTDFWPQANTEWFTYAGGSYPVYPLGTPDGGYARLHPLLQNLAAGDASVGLPGVTSVAGLWMDYEQHPQPWYGSVVGAQQNGVMPGGTAVISYYDSTSVPFPGKGQSVKQVYGTNIFSNGWPVPIGFEQYSFDLRTWLLDRSGRQALTDVYAGSRWFGNFEEFFSSTNLPFYDANGVSYPINRAPTAGTAAMPAVYADNHALSWFGLGVSGHPPLNQANADDVYWQTMLNTFSSSAQNAGSNGQSVPFVSQYVRDDSSGSYDYPMTVALYQELLRHVWLRGCMGMSVFNPYDPNVDSTKWYETADYSFHQLEYARAVMDEMLSFRSFLNSGTPMNFTVNAMFDHSAVWSGLALNGQAVVRAVSPNSATTNTIPAITVPGGGTFTNLAAPPGGATYLLGPGTNQHRVDARPAAAYMQMTQSYADSSGNGNGGRVWKYPPTFADPTFVTDVPAASILTATYGLYANQSNQYSLSLTRDPTIYTGNGISIPNTNNVFNAPAFTIEAFIKVASGVSQDAASLLSKGVNSTTQYTDWAISYRDSAGAGMVELTFGDSSPTNYAWIRTAGTPLTPGVWHHLALTYESATRQATLYVDGVAQAFGNHNDQISNTGVLAWDFVRHTGDQMIVGFFNKGIIGQFDEVRFTPEVLDPDQFLIQGPLP